MIRTAIVAATAALLATAAPALAKEYVDYTPEKGVWEILAVSVDPNHLDDYLTGLKQSQVPGFEALKKRGLIDAYKFVVRRGFMKDAPNVLIMTHVPNIALLAPDKARDQAIEKELLATFSEEQGKTAVAGYEKYRQFIDDGYWGEVTFTK